MRHPSIIVRLTPDSEFLTLSQAVQATQLGRATLQRRLERHQQGPAVGVDVQAGVTAYTVFDPAVLATTQRASAGTSFAELTARIEAFAKTAPPKLRAAALLVAEQHLKG